MAFGLRKGIAYIRAATRAVPERAVPERGEVYQAS
jgi:hypothetical protein